MSTTTITSEAVDLVAAATSVAVSTPLRVPFRIESGMGGLMTAKITNGATGPTGQCVVTLQVAHTDSTLPGAGAEGSTWKRFYTLGGGGSSNNGVTPFQMEIPPGPKNWQLEFSGPSGSAVTVEAQLTRNTGAVTAA